MHDPDPRPDTFTRRDLLASRGYPPEVVSGSVRQPEVMAVGWAPPPPPDVRAREGRRRFGNIQQRGSRYAAHYTSAGRNVHLGTFGSYEAADRALARIEQMDTRAARPPAAG